MKVAIDITPVLPPRTGIGHYSLALLEAMVPLAPEVEFSLFVNSRRREPPKLPIFNEPNVTVKQFKIPGPILHTIWQSFKYPPMEKFTGSFDVFHSPWGIIPPRRGGKAIATIHDLHFLKHPLETERWGGRLIGRTLPATLQRADAIITVSKTIKDEIVRVLDIPADRIHAIYHGIDQARFHRGIEQERVDAVRAEHNLPENYLLTVATIEPRKNVEGLLKAYARLINRSREAPNLVVVGMAGAKGESIKATAHNLNLTDRVTFTGFISNEGLPAIYKGATAYVQPSFEEGFGMTVLEALACGVPVAASDIPVFRELFQDAFLPFTPGNPDSVTESLNTIVNSEDVRERLLSAGKKIVERYSWEEAARQTLALYESLVQT